MRKLAHLLAASMALIQATELSAQDDGFVVHAVALAPDASAAVFGRVTDTGGDGRLLWRGADRAEPRSLRRASIVRGLAFAPNGRSVFATDDIGRVLHVASDGSLLHTFELGHVSGFCMGVAVSPDGARVAALDMEKRVQCFAVDSGERTFRRQTEALPICAVFLPDGRLAVGDNAGSLTLLSVAGETAARHAVLPGNVMQVAADPRGERLAVAGWKGEIAVLELATGTVRRHEPAGDRVHAIAFAPRGDLLAVAAAGRRVLLWSTHGDDNAIAELTSPRTIGALRWRTDEAAGTERLVGADYRGGVHRLFER